MLGWLVGYSLSPQKGLFCAWRKEGKKERKSVRHRVYGLLRMFYFAPQAFHKTLYKHREIHSQTYIFIRQTDIQTERVSVGAQSGAVDTPPSPTHILRELKSLQSIIKL